MGNDRLLKLLNIPEVVRKLMIEESSIARDINLLNIKLKNQKTFDDQSNVESSKVTLNL